MNLVSDRLESAGELARRMTREKQDLIAARDQAQQEAAHLRQAVQTFLAAWDRHADWESRHGAVETLRRQERELRC